MLTCEAGDLEVAEAPLLGLDEVVSADVVQTLGLQPLLCLVQLPQLVEEPGIDVGALKDLVQGHAILHCLHQQLPLTEQLSGEQLIGFSAAIQ